MIAMCPSIWLVRRDVDGRESDASSLLNLLTPRVDISAACWITLRKRWSLDITPEIMRFLPGLLSTFIGLLLRRLLLRNFRQPTKRIMLSHAVWSASLYLDTSNKGLPSKWSAGATFFASATISGSFRAILLFRIWCGWPEQADGTTPAIYIAWYFCFPYLGENKEKAM